MSWGNRLGGICLDLNLRNRGGIVFDVIFINLMIFFGGCVFSMVGIRYCLLYGELDEG